MRLGVVTGFLSGCCLAVHMSMAVDLDGRLDLQLLDGHSGQRPAASHVSLLPPHFNCMGGMAVSDRSDILYCKQLPDSRGLEGSIASLQ